MKFPCTSVILINPSTGPHIKCLGPGRSYRTVCPYELSEFSTTPLNSELTRSQSTRSNSSRGPTQSPRPRRLCDYRDKPTGRMVSRMPIIQFNCYNGSKAPPKICVWYELWANTRPGCRTSIKSESTVIIPSDETCQQFVQLESSLRMRKFWPIRQISLSFVTGEPRRK